MRPELASPVLTAKQQAVAMASRRLALLALNDCPYALQPRFLTCRAWRCTVVFSATAADFLRPVLDKLPYTVHTVLPNHGVQFTQQAHEFLPGGHRFDRICWNHGAEPRLTNPACPRANGQVERLNRTVKEATVRRHRYQTTAALNEHRPTFLLAYNHAKCLKTRRGPTPHEFVCARWQNNPTAFTRDPAHLAIGLYN